MQSGEVMDEFVRHLGKRWCETPDGLTEFEAFVRAHPSHIAVGDRKANEIEFFYDIALEPDT